MNINAIKNKTMATDEDDQIIPKYRVSDELAQFFDKPAGIKMNRSKVTNDIYNYVITHNLVVTETTLNGTFRRIYPNKKLLTILKPLDKQNSAYSILTLNTLQYHLKHNFKEQIDAEDNLAAQKAELEEFEIRFEIEEKEKRYQEFKKKKMLENNKNYGNLSV